jgi:hypothetical protein
MANRTLLNPAIVRLARDSISVADVAMAAPASANCAIQGVNAGTPSQSIDLRKILIRVSIGTTATTVTLHAAGNGGSFGDISGNAMASPYPSNAVFTQGATGDLAPTAPLTSTNLIIGPLSSDRYIQQDASGNTYYYLDFSQTTGVTVGVYELPFVLV